MSDKELKNLVILAQQKDSYALDKIVNSFKPCLIKNSIINGKFDEDCFQELNIKLIKCIYNFTFDSYDLNLKSFF